MRVFIFIFAVAFGLPALAQESIEKPLGTGPKGRFTLEQSQEIALRHVSGSILSVDSWWENDRFFYEFSIERPDTSIFEVAVNTLTGEVQDIEVEYLAPGASFPFPTVARSTAEAAAIYHIQHETLGKRRPQLRSIAFAAYRKQPAYKVAVKKSARIYEVFVDAFNGQVLFSQEME